MAYNKFISIRYCSRIVTRNYCIEYYVDKCMTYSFNMVLYNNNFCYIIFFINNNNFGVYDIKSDDICTFHISMLNDIIPYSEINMSVFQILGYK